MFIVAYKIEKLCILSCYINLLGESGSYLPIFVDSDLAPTKTVRLSGQSNNGDDNNLGHVSVCLLPSGFVQVTKRDSGGLPCVSVWGSWVSQY